MKNKNYSFMHSFLGVGKLRKIKFPFRKFKEKGAILITPYPCGYKMEIINKDKVK